jgi:nucleotide-binding universal stress UspA family protein
MDTSTKGAVVVGVTGPGRETAALRFAAECTARQGADVVLVHAYGASLPPPPPSILMTDSQAADVAAWVVKGVEEEFRELAGGSVPVRTMTVVGRPAPVLVDISRNARLVVVQHRDAHWLGRLFVGSTVNGVAAHGGCPVVSVPQEWEPPAPGEQPAEILVGVHEGGAPREALAAAMEWAAASGAPVRVVHAWRLDPAYDDIVTAQVAAEWHDEQVRALQTAMADLRSKRPSVPVTVEVLHQWPTQLLVDGSATASLVVVGRHSAHWRAAPHLGSTARTVLREATSPVMVVPVSPTGNEADDWDLEADELSPQA